MGKDPAQRTSAKEILKLSLLPEEYLTINGDIVIQLSRAAAVRAIKQVFGQLKQNGAAQETAVLRTQPDRIVPAFWEREITPQQPSVSSGFARTG